MHARRIDRARTGAARAGRLRRIPFSVPSWAEVGTPHSHKGASLNAVSAFDLSGHEPADAAATRNSNSGSTANSIEARAGTARLCRSCLAGNGLHVAHAARHQRARGRRIF